MMKPVYVAAVFCVALMGAACQKTETAVEAPEAPAVAANGVEPGPGVVLEDPSYGNGQALSNAELEALAAEARAAAGKLGMELKAELMAAIQADGPTGGVKACAEIAPAIAARISEETGMDVGRTSLKTRNPGNVADEWEVQTFERFLTAHENNFEYVDLDRFQLVEEDGHQVFRFMKPIVMGDVCAMCHGTEISEDVQAVLDEYYPEDQATGFAPGDLRGAFTVKKVLN